MLICELINGVHLASSNLNLKSFNLNLEENW